MNNCACEQAYFPKHVHMTMSRARCSPSSITNMRILQIGADRSKRGILYPGSSASMRQKAYGEKFGNLDIVGFSLKSDKRVPFEMPHTRVYPTNSFSRLF